MPTKHLTQYLNANFPIGSTAWTFTDVVNRFMEDFGVSVKTEDHTDGHKLYQFKYDMLGAKWQFPITHECRGIILRDSDSWEIVAHPYDKFFNQHEGNCRIFTEADFNAACAKLSFAEKADGTCIMVWYDRWNAKWRVSTLGSITTLIIHDSGTTFDTLFRNVVGVDIFKNLAIGSTYIFELCARLNRVVTRYPTDIAYLIGIRHADGQLASYDQIKNEVQHLAPVKLPLFDSFASLGITSLDAAQKYVESKISDKSLGDYPEGFVVYDEFGPVCKMKNSAYLALHHSLSDAACTRKAVVAAFFKGSMDDLYPALPEEFQKAADKLKDWLGAFRVYLNNDIAPLFKGQVFASRKDYAIRVQTLPADAKMFSGFFFAHQDAVCDPSKNLGDDFAASIQKTWEKYEDFWKKISYE